jgi:hypothetical protein
MGFSNFSTISLYFLVPSLSVQGVSSHPLAAGAFRLQTPMEPDEVAELLNANIELVSKAILYLSNTDRADIMSAIAQSLRSEVKQKAHFTKEEVKAS